MEPRRILALVHHFLTYGHDEKHRDKVKAYLDEHESLWRPLTHPLHVTPQGVAPAWWDEEEAGREALSQMLGGRAYRGA